jgi:hypothetical protein
MMMLLHHLAPIKLMFHAPPHLRALAELSFRSSLAIKMNPDMSLADIIERVPTGVEINYAYASFRVITNGKWDGGAL